MLSWSTVPKITEVLLAWSPVACIVIVCGAVWAEVPQSSHDILVPYQGPVDGTQIETLHGTVMAGYQGWFMADGDGYGAGFVHWGDVDHDPPRATVDMWPDMSELDPDERFDTNFRYADGTPAQVFSSTNRKTVLRHFRWMKEYGIDGVFVQRFTGEIDPSRPEDWTDRRTNVVLSHCREGANTYGRGFAVMYDSHFDRAAVDEMIADWGRLVHDMKILETPGYLRHDGAPVVTLWGYGFEHRRFDPAAVRELLEFIKRPENGGCTIMLGVPNEWHTWSDERMTLLKEFATIISPWNVGRFGDQDGAKEHYDKFFPAHLDVSEQHNLDYYPVIFPGFSWTNLRNGQSPLNQIPRQGGRFLWDQARMVADYGIDMAYVAMFDEVDEGTAIFKVSNHPPVGRFATYEGYPSDHYLNIVGRIGKLMAGEEVSFPDTQPDAESQIYQPQNQLEFYREPAKFAATTRDRWRKQFASVPIALHEGPFSELMMTLYNEDALDVRLSSWQAIDRDGNWPSPLAIFSSGGEQLKADDLEPSRIAHLLRRHVAQGNTLLVLAGGAYPAYYPGQGEEAAKFGLKLEIVRSPVEALLRPAGEFKESLADWKIAHEDGSRLMRKDLYPNAKMYESLVKVYDPSGRHLGDAVALVQPGGDLGEGTVVYVAEVMADHPQPERFWDALLNRVAPLATGD